MNVWALNAVFIEAMALVGVIGILVTRRTRVAFAVGFNTMLSVTGVYVLTAPPLNTRQVIILAMVLMYLAHMNWLLLFQRKHTAIPKLDAQIPLSQKYLLPVLLTNAVGWGYCLPFYFGARNASPLGLADGLAILMYGIATLVHFGSDYQKQRFKARPESQGKLLKTGFWALCRHPNYFGDFLIYIAFALIGRAHMGMAPVLNFLQYRFGVIPKSERWAAARYGPQWEGYRRRVKMFIPFVY